MHPSYKIWLKLEACMHTAIAATVSHSNMVNSQILWVPKADLLMVVETVVETVSGLPLNPTGAAWRMEFRVLFSR